MTDRTPAPAALYQHLALLRRLSPQAVTPPVFAEREAAEQLAARLSSHSGAAHVPTLEWVIDPADPASSRPVGWTWCRLPA